MTKIEVLRVPDERIWGGSVRDQGDGALVILRNGVFRTAVKPDEKPALLAALLEDAGAVEVEVRGELATVYGGWDKVRRRRSNLPLPQRFFAWLLPIPEDTP